MPMEMRCGLRREGNGDIHITEREIWVPVATDSQPHQKAPNNHTDHGLFSHDIRTRVLLPVCNELA